jgi:hypothetical protein
MMIDMKIMTLYVILYVIWHEQLETTCCLCHHVYTILKMNCDAISSRFLLNIGNYLQN